MEKRKFNNFIEFIGDGRGSKTLGEALCLTEKKVEELDDEIRILKSTRTNVLSMSAQDWVEKRLGKVVFEFGRKHPSIEGYVARAT